jgi:hypothetical protein
VEKTTLEDENTYLRAILSWVSSREPQLGMMIAQFKRGDGFGVGYAYTQSDFDNLYGKIGEASGLSPGEKPTSTPNTQNTTNGVYSEPPRAPPKDQVWIPKPNELRNPLDTLPPQAPPKNTPKQRQNNQQPTPQP